MFEADETETGTSDEQEHEEFLANLKQMSRNGGGTWRRSGRRSRSGAGTSDTDMAARLLDVQSEEELEQFLGSLVDRAAGAYKAAKDFTETPTGQAVVKVLKKGAGAALPVAGGLLGGYFGQPKLGQSAGGAVKEWLGWELEGLSEEDREFEVAKAFTRFATAAARQAAQAPTGASPEAVARAAAMTAARRYAPALLDWFGGGRGKQSEFEAESDEFESESYESESSQPDELEAEMEAAAQLLEITSEEELGEFVGSLIKKAASAVGRAVRSPVGQALGGALKGIARNPFLFQLANDVQHLAFAADHRDVTRRCRDGQFQHAHIVAMPPGHDDQVAGFVDGQLGKNILVLFGVDFARFWKAFAIGKALAVIHHHGGEPGQRCHF